MIALLMSLMFSTTFGVGGELTETAPVVVPRAADVASQGYDAINPRGRRRAIGVDRRSEDLILHSSARAQLQGTAAELHRNYALLPWAVRQHLNYVSSFTFNSQSGDQVFDEELEAMVAEHDRRIDFCDRHRFSKMVRLTEAGAVVNGDSGLLLIDDGADGRIQGIESDRIRDYSPTIDGKSGPKWVHGVETNEDGRPLRYAIHRRTPTGFAFERSVPVEWMLLRGYFTRFDQVRGISPLASALTSFQDVYEGVNLALAKAKVAQLFGVKITRNGVTSMTPTEVIKEELDEDGNPIPGTSKYKADFGAGPVVLDMDVGEDADFMNMATPTNEFREFMLVVIQLSLKCLDIPFSFYDEGHTNFFGSIGALNHYKRSCEEKIADNQAILDKEKQWRFGLWIRSGKLKLPKGLSLQRPFWEHVSRGMPWWDQIKELTGIGYAISMGMADPITAAKEHDAGDIFANIRSRAKVEAYAKEHNVELNWTPQQSQPAEPASASADAADDTSVKQQDTRNKKPTV